MIVSIPRQILLNYLSNAVKLTERGHILVEVCLRQVGLKVDGVDMVGRLRRVLGHHSLHVDLLRSYQPHKSHLL
ncbi:hypothetical protein [Pseudomonas sp. BF-R-24]|uniref:hypothetical protein n=1 Tax=Pseudomonas sp. BF-R-24 TaxID=2832386 RepID=UPI001CC1BD73|nr:hypothetical protein [Pseudomonas sp. BF-R-24]